MKRAIVTITAVIIAGLFLLWSVCKFKSYDQTVSVRGLCEREVKADVAIYPVVYKLRSNDMEQIYRDVNSNNHIVIDFLKEYGFTDDEITIGAPSIYENDGWKKDNASRYTATIAITVYTHKIDSVLSLRSNLLALIGKGVVLSTDNWSYPVQYEFNALNDIKPEMIEEANKNARAAAEKFAKDSDSKLGKIQNATQGLFSIEDRDQYTPQIKTVRVITYVSYYLK